ncbi:MAG: PRC-barrel domain-containing protein, partial [Chromatiaceae bacterium]
MNKHHKATLAATGSISGASAQRHHAANHAAMHAGSTEPYPVNADNPDTLLLGCKKLVGQRLKNHRGEVLGTLDSIVLDLKTGRISYAVLAYPSSFVAPPRLFALPWHA